MEYNDMKENGMDKNDMNVRVNIWLTATNEWMNERMKCESMIERLID